MGYRKILAPTILNMRLLIKFPTRERKNKFFQVLDLYIQKCNDLKNTAFLISMDLDDSEMNHPFTKKKFEEYKTKGIRLAYFYSNNKTKIQAINADIENIKGWDIVLLASDDMVPVIQGYDDIIRRDMKTHFPDTDGVLWYNDGHQERLNTLCILGKTYYERFDYIYHPDYISLWCDNEFMDVSFKLNRCYKSSETIIVHDHPVWTTGIYDKLYAKNEGYYRIDEETFKRRSSIGYGLEERTIKHHCSANLGDCVFHLLYLIECVKKYNNLSYIFYVREYINQKYISYLENIIPPEFKDRIRIKQVSQKPADSLEIWLATPDQGNFNRKIRDSLGRVSYNKIYYHWFNHISKIDGITSPFKNLGDFVFDLNTDHIHIDKKYQNLDVLIINSDPKSGQYHYEKDFFEEFIHDSCKGKNVAITQPLEKSDILCTQKDDLDLMQIAKISKTAKQVVAVNTGPIILCLNNETLTNIQKIDYLDIYNFWDQSPKFVQHSTIRSVQLI